ncbi:hypothetical protein Tco_0933133 [Tanacetum coccineum]
MANLPPPNNDPNVLEDEHAPVPEHAPIAPNPAPIQPNDYLADDDEDPKEEPKEEEEPIPKQAPDDDYDEEEIEAEVGKEEEEEEEVGGPSIAAPELPFPVGRLFSVIVDSVAVNHDEIGGLSIRTENLEQALQKLTMKMRKVEINKVLEVESHVLKMKDRVNAHPCDQVVGLRGDVDRVLRLSQKVQTLETALQGTMSENQQLWTRLAKSESRESTMSSYIMWMEKRLTTLEERLQGPSLGPKYVERGSQLFLVHVMEKEPNEKRLEDVTIIHDFPKVFPDDLPGLPPPRQVEFRIELVPGAAPVAHAPYRLAPSELKELSYQLKELLEKGFI